MKYLFLFLVICSCNGEVPNTLAFPKNFKVRFNHHVYGSRIMLPVTFGTEEKKYRLQFDNHSPSWLNDEIIRETKSLKKVKNTYYNTSVADGSKVEGVVYICDTLSLGGIKFNDVLFYQISDTGRKTNGVIGENIISLGVWMIDSWTNSVTFASSADSLGKLISEIRVLPSTFKNNTFTIETLINGVKKKFEVDIGFNGSAILPLKDFIEIKRPEKTISHPLAFTTPSGTQLLENYTSHEKILLGIDSVSFAFTSNEKVVESLVGYGFFRQFDFVILDYPNKQIYVSR